MKQKPRWSAHEIARLRAYAEKGLTSREAAEKLGRGHATTRLKAVLAGIAFGQR